MATTAMKLPNLGNMLGEQIEFTPAHATYLLLPAFLIFYVLGATWVRNVLHLSEPPIALLMGIILGPRGLGWLTPNLCSSRGCRLGEYHDEGVGGWGWGDTQIYEFARLIVVLQVFSVAVELPRYYFQRHIRSVLILLGPVMTFSWISTAALGVWVLGLSFQTSLVISACLTPTDPVLASSILSNSLFSTRVPPRLKHVLSAESGCNDGVSFPFLFAGLFWLTAESWQEGLLRWFSITMVWQCLLGTLVGLLLGFTFNRLLRFSEKHKYVDEAGLIVFYVLLAFLAMGIGSTLGLDDFLVAFFAGHGFARDGWFSKKTEQTHLPAVLDLLLNSAMFVYLGTILPWPEWAGQDIAKGIMPGTLVLFALAVIVFRRLPVVLPLYRWTPDIRTLNEAWFAGHFGPMGLGAVFLSMEARAILENGTSTVEPRVPHYGYPYTERERAAAIIWPVVSFVVFASTIVHGALSVGAISLVDHFTRPKNKRSNRVAGEEDPLPGMDHVSGNGDSEPEFSDEEPERVREEVEHDTHSN